MSPRLPLRWLVCFFMAIGCSRDTSDPEITSPDAAPIDDPVLVRLAGMNADERTIHEFLDNLEGLAKKQGWQQELTECKKHPLRLWDEGRAASVRSKQSNYVVVFLRAWDRIIPGTDLQTLILLDNQGRFLDRLACEINSRLSRMHFGKFHTVVSSQAQADGAQLVVRLDGGARGNFAHHIHHQGTTASFYWGDSPVWDLKGLCRIAIQDGKFRVVFPTDKEQLR